MSALLELMRRRASARAPFDPARPVPRDVLAELLEAARWAPTAHNMQNFELIVVEDAALIAALGDVAAPASAEFIRENRAHLAATADELRARKVGILAGAFPAAWRDPATSPEDAARASAPRPLRDLVDGAPTVLVVVRDPARRAPASDGDELGTMSLGCVMENLWLVATERGLGFQILSAFSAPAVEPEVRRVLGVPPRLHVAFAARLGYPRAAREQVRVRRDVADFVHRDRYGARLR